PRWPHCSRPCAGPDATGCATRSRSSSPTGMDCAAELVFLQWANIDLKGATIAVWRAKGGMTTEHPLRSVELRLPGRAAPGEFGRCLCPHVRTRHALEHR